MASLQLPIKVVLSVLNFGHPSLTMVSSAHSSSYRLPLELRLLCHDSRALCPMKLASHVRDLLFISAGEHIRVVNCQWRETAQIGTLEPSLHIEACVRTDQSIMLTSAGYLSGSFAFAHFL
jgi:hypothetical protein